MSARSRVLDCAGAVISQWRQAGLTSLPDGLEQAIQSLNDAVQEMCSSPHARSTDPHTSRQGPSEVRMRQSHHDVLKVLALRPLTDIELTQAVSEKMSPSGARTRRAELVRMGLVEASGRRRRSANGREHTVWQRI